jgi:hypothetical protein
MTIETANPAVLHILSEMANLHLLRLLQEKSEEEKENHRSSEETLSAKLLREDDGSVTLSLNELDLVENGKTEAEARLALGESILDYAEDFSDDFEYWSAAPNRKDHLPYVLKALSIHDAKILGDSIKCQAGGN